MRKKALTIDEVIEKFNLNNEKQGNGKKPFRKNLRFGLPVLEAFALVDGDGFNDTFQNMCIEFARSKPQREREIVGLDKEIANKREYLQELKKAINDIEWLTRNVNTLKSKFADVDQITSRLIKSDTPIKQPVNFPNEYDNQDDDYEDD